MGWNELDRGRETHGERCRDHGLLRARCRARWRPRPRGAPLDDDNGGGSGSVYLYERRTAGWERTAKWIASDGQPSDLFGRYVDIDGDRAAVSSIHDDDLENDAGSAYVYELASAFSAYCFCASGPCGNDDAFGGCSTFGGAGARLAACGSASVTSDDLVLTATGLTPSQFGLVFMGAGTLNLPFGDGVRCVGPAGVGVFRYAVTNAGPAGTIAVGPGIVAFSGSSRVAVGTPVTRSPPLRSQRAALPHWAPTSGVWRRSGGPAMDE
jgi:hypothetical protein